MRTIMQVLTLEGWSDLTYNYSDANSPTISVLFFIGIVVLGAFFAMNIVLGAVMDSYNDVKENRQTDAEEKREEEEK